MFCLLFNIYIFNLEFLIPPQSVGYMDLRRSTLKIKLRLTNALGQPVAKDANVGLVILPLQAVFSQVDCSLQKTSVTQTGTNYPYKVYIDMLLETGANDRVLWDSQLFEKDTTGQHEKWSQHWSVHTLHAHDEGIGRTPSPGRL
jgi:hypothetical protein